MAPPLTKGIIIILVVNIMLYLGGLRLIDTGVSTGANTDLLGKFVNVSGTNGSVETSQNFRDSVPDTFQEGGSGTGILDFLDPIGLLIDFIVLIVNVVFSPLALFTENALPVVVQWMVGVPLMVSEVLGLIYFIRSGQ